MLAMEGGADETEMVIFHQIESTARMKRNKPFIKGSWGHVPPFNK